MGNGALGWQIVEADSYERAVAQCGSHQFFDQALAPIDYALNQNPTGFRLVPGSSFLYLAKTKLRLNGLEVIPSFRLWFRINEESRTVTKLWVEIAPPEDMGIGESLWDSEDDIPF